MKRSFALIAAVGLMFVVNDAQAGSPGWGPYWGGGVYTSGVRGWPPYFSLFPPVYYSYPVPRTYGYSPFAYPLGSPTPEITITDAQPGVMINPYVPKAESSGASLEKTAGGPLTIINPFVEPKVDLARDAK